MEVDRVFRYVKLCCRMLCMCMVHAVPIRAQ